MQIQVRIRTNDVSDIQKQDQLVHDGFLLFDNCVEIKYGKAKTVDMNEFRYATNQMPDKEKVNRKFRHSETKEIFEDVIFMTRDIGATERRLKADLELRGKTQAVDLSIVLQKDRSNFYLSPYHFNVIEWKDRITNKRYRLVYDTVCFIMDDKGDTLRKIEG